MAVRGDANASEEAPMESERFDQVVRCFAISRTRRGVLKSLVGAGLGAAGVSRGRTDTAAICNPATDRCCPGYLCPDGTCGFNSPQRCGCAKTQCKECEVCNRRCVRSADGAACPDDGNACTENICRSGRCEHPPKQDGLACSGGRCSNGVCCASGRVGCDGACVDTQSDPRHCGACGRACAAADQCFGGVCVCADGQARCGSACVDLLTDATNCGACGRVCGQGQSCCQGACVNLNASERHCGVCNHRCKNHQVCRRGRCQRQ